MKNNTRKILLAFILVFTMIIGMTAITASAADDSTVYLKPGNDWNSAGARFAVYYFQDGMADGWASMTDSNSDGVFEATIPAGYTNIIFCRMNPDFTDNGWNTGSEGENDPKRVWNQTVNVTLSADDTFVIDDPWGDDNNGKKAKGHWESGASAGDSGSGSGTTDSDKTIKVYAGNSAGWETVYCYYWIDGQSNPNWPGEVMEDEGDGIWSFEIPDNYNRVIFNNGNGQQTEDLVIPTDGKTNVCDTAACIKGSKNTDAWSTKENYKPSTPPAEPENTTREVTLVVKNSANWESVYVYYWPCDGEGSGWPGEELTAAADGLYYAVIPEGNYYVIFNNGKEGEELVQTADMVIPTDDNVLYDNFSDTWSEMRLEANHPAGTPSTDGGKKMTFLQKAAKVLLICLRSVELFFKNIGKWFVNLFAGFKK